MELLRTPALSDWLLLNVSLMVGDEAAMAVPVLMVDPAVLLVQFAKAELGFLKTNREISFNFHFKLYQMLIRSMNPLPGDLMDVLRLAFGCLRLLPGTIMSRFGSRRRQSWYIIEHPSQEVTA